MKRTISTILLCLVFHSYTSAKLYYVSTWGNDTGTGTFEEPWGTWQNAFESAQAGDTVYFRGGVYYKQPGESVLYIPRNGIGHDGTYENPICFLNYPGESPILDCARVSPDGDYNTGLYIDGLDYAHFRGLTIRNVWQSRDGVRSQGLVATNCTNLTFENMTVHDIGGRGIYFDPYYSPDTSRFINCDVYNCIDSLYTGDVSGGWGDGWQAVTLDNSFLLFEGCRAWNCSDDGFNVTSLGLLIMKNNWSFGNGLLGGDGCGFKLNANPETNDGDLTQIITNNIAAFNNTGNTGSGFTENNNGMPTSERRVYNNTAYKNKFGFVTLGNNIGPQRNNDYRNNIAYGNSIGDIDENQHSGGVFYTNEYNTWNIELGVTVTDEDFVSLDKAQLYRERKADFSLPDIAFLKLNEGSDLIDIGIDVQLPYNGDAPDLGAIEYDYQPETNNKYPSAIISSPSNGSEFYFPGTITITVNATDEDGSISKVEFFNGETKLGEKTTGPWAYTWNSVSVGTYTLTAVATDNQDAKTSSLPVHIDVKDNTHPLIEITSPSEGSSFSAPASINISTNTTDSDGTISKVEFFNGETKLGEKTSSPWAYTWNSVSVGTYTLTAVATDNQDAKTSSLPVHIDVKDNTHPLIEITSPSEGSSFSAPASINISTNTTDSDGTISKVEFFNGETKLGEKTSSPWAYTWNSVSVGTYTLTAVATDNQDAKTSSLPVHIDVKDNTHPLIEITSPSEGSSFTAPASINISTNTTDSDGTISKVEFFNGETKLGEKTSSPWAYTWNSVSVGTYTLTAVATDNQDAKTSSLPVHIDVKDNTHPLIEITSPSEGSSFTAPASINISTNTYDSDGSISKVEFFSGETKLGEKTTGPWAYTWNSVSVGTYTLTAVATDNQDAKTSSLPVHIDVKDNTHPLIEITSPSEGSSFSAPASINISTNTTDSDGTISKVEFFNGETKLGEKTTGPWTYTWNSVSVGTYTLTAVATDNQDAKTSSLPVHIDVKDNTHPLIEITSPSEGSSFSAPASINISTNTYDSDGSISKVEFFNGETKLGEKTTGPWTYTWNSVSVGTYTLTAVATDNQDAKTSSLPVHIDVKDDTHPLIEITSPSEGSSFTAPASINISTNTYDSDGSISKVEFFSGETKLGEKTSSPWAFTWKNVSAGTYSLTAVLTDNLEANVTSAPITVLVNNNTPPYIEITSPANGSEFEETATIQITAYATDEDGLISKVEFFNGETKLGEKTSSPWIYTWSNVPVGNYSLTAVALDNLETKSISEPLSIIVNQIIANHTQDYKNGDTTFELFPNPTKGNITFLLNDSRPIKKSVISITSMDGKVVYNGILFPEENRKQFDFSHFMPGIYVFILSENETILKRQFLIE